MASAILTWNLTYIIRLYCTYNNVLSSEDILQIKWSMCITGFNQIKVLKIIVETFPIIFNYSVVASFKGSHSYIMSKCLFSCMPHPLVSKHSLLGSSTQASKRVVCRAVATDICFLADFQNCIPISLLCALMKVKILYSCCKQQGNILFTVPLFTNTCRM